MRRLALTYRHACTHTHAHAHAHARTRTHTRTHARTVPHIRTHTDAHALKRTQDACKHASARRIPSARMSTLSSVKATNKHKAQCVSMLGVTHITVGRDAAS
eukprot:4246164-Pleurochrysis_carterae.AAC.1